MCGGKRVRKKARKRERNRKKKMLGWIVCFSAVYPHPSLRISTCDEPSKWLCKFVSMCGVLLRQVMLRGWELEKNKQFRCNLFLCGNTPDTRHDRARAVHVRLSAYVRGRCRRMVMLGDTFWGCVSERNIKLNFVVYVIVLLTSKKCMPSK